MPIIDADPADLRDALLRLRTRYLDLEEPRRWYSALVCSILVRRGDLPEWTDWLVEPPRGSDIQLTPAVDDVIDTLFGVPARAVLRPVEGGAIDTLGKPNRIVVDPLRQPGHATDVEALCVVADKRRLDVPLSDPAWVWNDPDTGAPVNYGETQPEIKHSGDYGSQQGIFCFLPADQLFELEAEADDVLSTPRPQCPHWAIRDLPRRSKADDAGPPPSQPTASCGLSLKQCASKGGGTAGPGGPRALIPDVEGSSRKLLAPGSFDRILEDANPNGVPLPSASDMALVLDYLHKGHGKALDANRLNELILPQHSAVLFD
jgi:hypothetical protein